VIPIRTDATQLPEGKTQASPQLQMTLKQTVLSKESSTRRVGVGSSITHILNVQYRVRHQSVPGTN